MMAKSALTLGPLAYHWNAEKRRDFYFRVADEAAVDCVYLGETVCSKRAPFFAPYRAEVIERLQKAGKQVVLSSLALLTTTREVEALKEDASTDLWIEANDVAAIQVLKEIGSKKPFVVGPTINVLNEGTLDAMAERGARRVVFASELKGKALCYLAAKRRAVEKEVQIFGRQPLAVSMRCYHARAAGRDKAHCQSACASDADGLTVGTLSGQKILAVTGTQTLSSGCLLLAEEAREMQKAGITHFRLSPMDVDMVATARLYRDFLDEKIGANALRAALEKTMPGDASFINGFYHGREGLAQVGI